jgi:Pectate lyase superfamily protein/Putative Ig domain
MTILWQTCVMALLLACPLLPAATTPGATVPWTTYEAEAMTISGGTVLGPQAQTADKEVYPPNTVERESSGQQCVQLTAAGSYVQFTAAGSANAMVIRYSIPDSANGAGISSTLTVTVNGGQSTNLALTSAYSWRYGSYPFSNAPGDATAGGATPFAGPRNYYDEVRSMGLAINAGDTVRIAKTANDAAAYLIIDLVDLETVPAAIGQPAGSLSVKAAPYSAKGDGVTDDTAAIQAALTAGQGAGKTVYIPPGSYVVTANFSAMSSIMVQGAGMWYATLVGNPSLYNSSPGSRIQFTGAAGANNIALADFAIIGRLNYRNDGEANDGIQGEFGTGSSIRRIWIEHTKTGIWPRNSSGLVVDSCRIRNTIADGINFNIGMRSSTISNCTARGTGDDSFAFWPESAADIGGTERFTPGLNVLQNCTALGNSLANGSAIYGGQANTIQDCLFQDIAYGAGIFVAGNFPVSSDGGFSGTTVLQHCTIIHAGGFDTAEWHGALTIDPSAKNIPGMTISGMTISSSLADGIMFMGGGAVSLSGASMSNVSVSNFGLVAPRSNPSQNVDGTWGVWARSDASGSITVSGLTVNGTATLNDHDPDLIVNQTGTPPKFTFIFTGGAAPGITSALTAAGTVGSAFATYAISASNAPTSFAASGLPAGLSVNAATGAISGTPTGSGTANVTISATNGAGTGSAILVITIGAAVSHPAITSPLTAAGTLGSAFAYQITGSDIPTSYQATGLPAGLGIATASGMISGIPTAAGSTHVTISATNGSGTGSATLVITISAAGSAPAIISPLSATGTVGQAFAYQIMAAGTPTGYNATDLPPGLGVNTATGQIAGTPTTAGTFNATISASDGGGTSSANLVVGITSSASGGTAGGEGGGGSSSGHRCGFGAGAATALGFMFLAFRCLLSIRRGGHHGALADCRSCLAHSMGRASRSDDRPTPDRRPS